MKFATKEYCFLTLLFLLVSAAGLLFAQSLVKANSSNEPVGTKRPIVFRKQLIASESFESVGVFDVNNDKQMDIVSGSYCYKGPGFIQRHYIGPVNRYGEYYDDFSNVVMDVNCDGWMDFITGGWNDSVIYWRMNPGNTKEEWENIAIGKTGSVETTRAWDIDGNGIPEIVPNNPLKPVKVFRLITDAKGRGTGRFDEYQIWNRQGHGMGFGDINGDGRGDLLLDNGWLESPIKPFEEKWIFHQEYSLQAASIPIIVTDVNGDGRNDFIAGKAHDYGLYWYEQQIQTDNKRTWKRHPIDPYNSQYHTMQWEDLDGDGRPELITGKRYRAHNDEDPGATDPVGLYYFQWNGESFTKQVISYGAVGKGKGTGIYFQVADVNGDGRKDIIVAGKDGLCVFYNEGRSSE